MKDNEISVLIGEMNERAHHMGEVLNELGCRIIYSHSSPLNIQFEAIRTHPDAIIVSRSTKYPKQLCENLKGMEKKPYIVLISNPHDKINMKAAEGLIDRIIYGKLTKEELFSIIYSMNAAKASQASKPMSTYKLPVIQEPPAPKEKEMTHKEVIVHNAITQVLNKLCITPNYNGYIYIREAIKIAVNVSTAARGITKLVYPTIAQNLGVTAAGVERSIRTAIRRSWEKVKLYDKAEYFGTYALKEEWLPTNSEYIFILADRIKCKINEETAADAPPAESASSDIDPSDDNDDSESTTAV